MGEANIVASMLVPLSGSMIAFIVLPDKFYFKLVSYIFFFLCLILGLFTFSRTFWLGTFFIILALLYLYKRRININFVGKYLLLIILTYLILNISLPQYVSIIQERILGSSNHIEMSKNEFKNNVYNNNFEDVLDYADSFSRIGLSLVQLEASFNSIFFGHGSNEKTSRWAHSMIPTAMYDYGLAFTIPLLTFFFSWILGAYRQSRYELSMNNLSPISLGQYLLALSTLGILLFNDFFITDIRFSCLIFSLAGLFSSTYNRSKVYKFSF